MASFFDTQIHRILSESAEYKSAVAVIKHKNKWLLGLSTSNDDRNKKWCFPGGGIKSGETPKQAAVREAKEETGLRVKATGEPFTVSNLKHVAFVPCSLVGKPNFDMNNEFSAIGFFTTYEMKSISLFKNVKKIMEKSR